MTGNATYAVLVERFREMKELALLLNARRTGSSIDFDLPEPVIRI